MTKRRVGVEYSPSMLEPVPPVTSRLSIKLLSSFFLALSLRAHPLLIHSQMLAHLGCPVEGALLLVRRPHLEREVEEGRKGKRESIRNTIQVCRTYTLQVCMYVCW